MWTWGTCKRNDRDQHRLLLLPLDRSFRCLCGSTLLIIIHQLSTTNHIYKTKELKGTTNSNKRSSRRPKTTTKKTSKSSSRTEKSLRHVSTQFVSHAASGGLVVCARDAVWICWETVAGEGGRVTENPAKSASQPPVQVYFHRDSCVVHSHRSLPLPPVLYQPSVGPLQLPLRSQPLPMAVWCTQSAIKTAQQQQQQQRRNSRKVISNNKIREEPQREKERSTKLWPSSNQIELPNRSATTTITIIKLRRPVN